MPSKEILDRLKEMAHLYVQGSDDVRGKWEEAAKVRIKIAMDRYPEYEWRIVTGKKRTVLGKKRYVFEVMPAAEALSRKKRG